MEEEEVHRWLKGFKYSGLGEVQNRVRARRNRTQGEWPVKRETVVLEHEKVWLKDYRKTKQYVKNCF